MNISNYQLLPLIGQLKERFQELKIKDHVDHAGHSLPPVLPSHGLCSAVNHGIYQSNNLLIVLPVMEITDAMVDGHQMLLNMLKIMV
jgi:hypothetical protein